jgi:LemA protein
MLFMLGIILDVVAVIAVLVVLILIGTFVSIYNVLVTLSNNVKKAWADIDVLLEKRHDMLGKLMDTVSGYAKYERSVLTQVTKARTAWMGAQKGTVQNKIDASNQISTALKSIFAVAENYPDLKADNNFMQLQQAITEIESQIADRREFYNDAVNLFNIRIQQIPYTFFAGMLHYASQPLFQVPEEEKQDVKIRFDTGS